mmetsp:Transcript_63006/g.135287  ORF Transcript_63006/g.135287 Transcript_63006/m.135287 type:complete len:267 (-) Transcript_63006:345-1145(-)
MHRLGHNPLEDLLMHHQKLGLIAGDLDGGGTSLLEEKRPLTEASALVEATHHLAIDNHRRLSPCDHEEGASDRPLLEDMLATGVKLPLVARDQPTDLLLRKFLKARDFARQQRLPDVVHGLVNTLDTRQAHFTQGLGQIISEEDAEPATLGTSHEAIIYNDSTVATVAIRMPLDPGELKESLILMPLPTLENDLHATPRTPGRPLNDEDQGKAQPRLDPQARLVVLTTHALGKALLPKPWEARENGRFPQHGEVDVLPEALLEVLP